ncbi:hypothetical protein P8452_17903 [Trifolium repens]|nr:hypothetical protein P8452_17903 [Trifolium repens]
MFFLWIFYCFTTFSTLIRRIHPPSKTTPPPNPSSIEEQPLSACLSFNPSSVKNPQSLRRYSSFSWFQVSACVGFTVRRAKSPSNSQPSTPSTPAPGDGVAMVGNL